MCKNVNFSPEIYRVFISHPDSVYSCPFRPRIPPLEWSSQKCRTSDEPLWSPVSAFSMDPFWNLLMIMIEKFHSNTPIAEFVEMQFQENF